MLEARGVRIGWPELPARVRAGIEDVLGSPVSTARSQSGGFSPGSADRVVLADGRRAFVKAVSSAQNPDTPDLHRAEAQVAAALPVGTPAARLIGSYDDGAWVALVFDDVDGYQPRTPWRRNELDATIRALRTARGHLTPTPLPGAPSLADTAVLQDENWAAVRDHPPADLDAWAAVHVDELVALEAYGRSAVDGDTLVHADVRADNVLVRGDGTAVLVDWPWASNGAWWYDTVLLAANVRCYGGIDADALLVAECADVDPDAVTGVLAALVGFLLEHARRPAPPGLATVRAFQQGQADALLPWLRARAAR